MLSLNVGTGTTGSNKQKSLKTKLIFGCILKATDEKSRIRNPVYGFKDPDPYQNVMDPEH